ncbi:putative zinc-binding protein [Methanobrevibacter sp.]
MKKVALASCNGMSPNGLVSRVAVGDARKENEEVISICMGSTSADIEGANDKMLKKYPIIAINGCSGGCVNKILNNRHIDIAETISITDTLENYEVSAKDPFRLDGEAEECVKIIKNEINNKINQIRQ